MKPGESLKISRRVFVIYGGYSCGNFGDELILMGIAKLLTTWYEDPLIYVWPIRGYQEFRVHQFEEINESNFITLGKIIMSADAVIIGGGGLLQEYSIHNSMLRELRRIVKLVSLFNTNIFLLFVGAGPFLEESVTVLAEVIKHARIIGFRDDDSRVLVSRSQRAPICVIGDAAYLNDISPADKISLGGDEMTIGFSIAGYFKYCFQNIQKQEEIADVVTDVIRYLLREHKCKIILFPFQYGHEGDVFVAEDIMNRVGVSGERLQLFNFSNGYDETIRTIAACDVFVGMRLHSLVLCALLGIPFVGLAYNQKVRSLIAKYGMEEYACGASELDFGALKSRIELAIDRKSILRKAILSMTSLEKNKNFERLQKVKKEMDNILQTSKKNIPPYEKFYAMGRLLCKQFAQYLISALRKPARFMWRRRLT